MLCLRLVVGPHGVVVGLWRPRSLGALLPFIMCIAPAVVFLWRQAHFLPLVLLSALLLGVSCQPPFHVT